MHPAFDGGFTVLIFVNCVVLAMDHHGIDSARAVQLETISAFLSIAFAVELGLKLCAYDLRQFFADKFNIFDTFIVAAGVCELILEYYTDSTGGISALRASRTARAARATRALRATRAMRALRMVGHVEYLYVGAFS